MERLMEFASSVPDFRRTAKGNHRHRLDDILILIVLARASKCVGRAGIVEFGKHNLTRFRKMGLLMNGVPSEPTLCRVEKGIDSLCMAERMTDFMDAFRRELISGRDIICVDGKAMRGTLLQNGRNPDIVPAYLFNAGITLITEACREKSNEITAIPQLLDKLDIAGDVVTADAISVQKEIIDKIREKNGDFVIELKANRRSLRYVIEERIKTRRPCKLTRKMHFLSTAGLR